MRKYSFFINKMTLKNFEWLLIQVTDKPPAAGIHISERS